MPLNKRFAIAVFLLLAFFATGSVYAAENQAGRFVQLRGSATIERGKARISAKVKDGIVASDTITTGDKSRAKLLFIDDSVLTLSDNSKLVVKEFIHSKGEKGKSVFNLLDGKMRSVVGKTRFEVHTPTAVAAARGTVIYFDVGRVNNQSFSRIICLEGNVQIRNVVTTITGQVTLTPGTMVIVRANEPPPPPAPAPQVELDRARRATSSNGNSDNSSGSSDGSSSSSSSSNGSSSGSSSSDGSSSSSSGSSSSSSSGGTQPSGGTGGTPQPPLNPLTGVQIPTTPPIQQQPIVQPRKVNITIGIPKQ